METNSPMKIKNSTLPIATFVAAIAALALLPVSAAAAGAAVTVTGVISIFAADYGRAERTQRTSAEVVPLSESRAEEVEHRKAA